MKYLIHQLNTILLPTIEKYWSRVNPPNSTLPTHAFLFRTLLKTKKYLIHQLNEIFNTSIEYDLASNHWKIFSIQKENVDIAKIYM